jgi:hypothetical protein
VEFVLDRCQFMPTPRLKAGVFCFFVAPAVAGASRPPQRDETRRIRRLASEDYERYGLWLLKNSLTRKMVEKTLR